MHLLAFLLSTIVMAIVLWDAFETVILPRTVSRRLRLTRLYFRFTWRWWSELAGMFRTEHRRERFLAIFGPLSLLGLATVWALGLLIGFAVLQWSAGSNLEPATGRFIDDLYLSCVASWKASAFGRRARRKRIGVCWTCAACTSLTSTG